MYHTFRATAATALAAILSLSGIQPAYAAPRQYDDFDSITGQVDTVVPQQLGIGSPAQDIFVTSDAYYITGTSNPNEELYLNGEPVTGRGIYGSFGVYAPLSSGANTFTFKQDSGTGKAVTITKGEPTIYTTKAISSMYPAADSAYEAGNTMVLRCTAPSGASVTASYGGGQPYAMTQVAAAQPGVPATFKVEIPAGEVSAAQNVGKVQYVLNDNKTFTSGGNLYLYPRGTAPLIQVSDTAATIFATSNTSGDIITVAKKGAIDYVTDQTEDCYKLGMGGWVPKDSVAPLLTGTVQNRLSGVSFSKSAYGERYKFSGTTNPIATSWQTGEKLYVELHHTGGSINIPTQGSALFTGATATPGEDSIILEFSLKDGKTLWGHTLEYADGVTTLYCKYKPTATGGRKPLTDIIVALDPGHGGTDPGAFGTARLLGPAEKDINRATALAVQKRLESLGATVLISPYQEAKSTVADRMQAPMDGKADLFISLHCNSVSGNGLKPRGVEIYYYYSRSKGFAEALLSGILTETGRTNRGVKNNSFRVTLNSLTPAVLIEMGFISNPQEYDSLCSREGIFQMANGIGNGVVSYLS